MCSSDLENKLHLLVATTVIEVGVDVPNSSLMIIENPERLGLAQLHQLRGRVGRGSVASHCVLLYHSPLSKTAQKRLGVLRESNDGFVIAQRDLEIRGPGELLGTKQTGLADFNQQVVILSQPSKVRALLHHRSRRVLGPGNLVSPSSLPRIPATADQARAIALRDHPDIIQVQHQVAASEVGVAIAQSNMSPTVSLQGTYGFDESFDSEAGTRGGTVGLNVSGPIYQGGQLSSIKRQAYASRDQRRAALLQLTKLIPQSVTNAYANLRVAQAARAASDEQVRAATVAFRGTREEATLGARTTLDVLDAEQELLDARNTQISAVVDETIAAYTVLYTMGQLTAEDLALNVPRYDPAEYYNLVKSAPVQSRQGADLNRILKAMGKQ